MIFWLTGNTGAGKTYTAKVLKEYFLKDAITLDGDDLRAIWPGLKFTMDDRAEQNCRTARLAKYLHDQGNDVIVAVICPTESLRKEVRDICNCEFIYIEGGLEGIDFPFETPKGQILTISSKGTKSL